MTSANRWTNPLLECNAYSRRMWLWRVAACGLAFSSTSRRVQASSIGQARLDHRLDLWRSFAMRSSTMVARCELTHESSLLQKPLRVQTTLGCLAPNLVVIAPVDGNGVQTLLDLVDTRVVDGKNGQLLLSHAAIHAQPAASWLAAHLRALFLPGDGSELLAQSTVVVPAAAKPRIDLEPPAEHPAAAVYRSLSFVLDAKSGAVVQWSVEQAGGDRIVAKLSAHRQGVAPDEIAALARLRA